MRYLLQLILIVSIGSCSPEGAERASGNSEQIVEGDAIEGVIDMDTATSDNLDIVIDGVSASNQSEAQVKVLPKVVSLEKQISSLKSERIQIVQLKTNEDNEIRLNQGTILKIPRTAVAGYAAPRIEVLEAYNFSDIILNRLTTVTRNNQLLASFGMIEIGLYDGADTVEFKDVCEVLFPATDKSEAPLLFTGFVNDNSIKWEETEEVFMEFTEVIGLTVGSDFISHDFPIVDFNPTPENKAGFFLKYISDRLALTYKEKVEFSNFLASSDNSESGYHRNELGFKIGVVQDNKRIQCDYPKPIRNKVEPIIRDYIKTYSPSFKTNQRLYLWIVDRSKEDSLRNVFIEEDYFDGLDYYRYRVAFSTGWLNCDYYRRNADRPEKILVARKKLSRKARVYAKLDGISSFVNLSLDGRNPEYYSTEMIQRNQPVTVIIIDEKSDGYYLALERFEQNRPSKINKYQLEEVTFDELRLRLDNLQ